MGMPLVLSSAASEHRTRAFALARRPLSRPSRHLRVWRLATTPYGVAKANVRGLSLFWFARRREMGRCSAPCVSCRVWQLRPGRRARAIARSSEPDRPAKCSREAFINAVREQSTAAKLRRLLEVIDGYDVAVGDSRVLACSLVACCARGGCAEMNVAPTWRLRVAVGRAQRSPTRA